MSSNEVVVRPVVETDHMAFLAMWEDFVSLAPDEPGEREMGELNWSRMMDAATGLRGIVAVDGSDEPIGFTLFLTFPFTWSRGDACYLQDIYVRPQSRGKGVAQAMIGQLRDLGEAAGWFKIFWMTQPDNFDAQRVYDKVAKRMDYLRYDLNVGDP